MYTQTIIYKDADLSHIWASTNHMEETGWSVRHTEVLAPISEVRKSRGPDKEPVTAKIISILVVYEREQA
jgi:hypothetical protein